MTRMAPIFRGSEAASAPLDGDWRGRCPWTRTSLWPWFAARHVQALGRSSIHGVELVLGLCSPFPSNVQICSKTFQSAFAGEMRVNGASTAVLHVGVLVVRVASGMLSFALALSSA